MYKKSILLVGNLIEFIILSDLELLTFDKLSNTGQSISST